MEGIAATRGVPYWDLLPENERYTYMDGDHLDTTSARSLSAGRCAWQPRCLRPVEEAYLRAAARRTSVPGIRR